jgi:CheY-like chemotaxis protein
LPISNVGGGVTIPNSKVLLVEDSKFLRLSNERVLTKAGYEVSTAADGEEALRIAGEKLPDIILLDMMLPKLSGPDVLRKLKENPTTSAIPVIVLSSLSQKNEEKLIHDGAAAYFEKSARSGQEFRSPGGDRRDGALPAQPAGAQVLGRWRTGVRMVGCITTIRRRLLKN